MLFIELNRHRQICFQEDDVYCIWDADDFELKFGQKVPRYRKLTYEPDRDVLVVCKENLDDIHVLKSPNDDPFMFWLSRNVGTMRDQAEVDTYAEHNIDEDELRIWAEIKNTAIRKLKERGELRPGYEEIDVEKQLKQAKEKKNG